MAWSGLVLYEQRVRRGLVECEWAELVAGLDDECAAAWSCAVQYIPICAECDWCIFVI